MDIVPTGAIACLGRAPGTPCVTSDGVTDGYCQQTRFGMDCVASGRQTTQLTGRTAATCIPGASTFLALALFMAVGVAWWRRPRREVA